MKRIKKLSVMYPENEDKPAVVTDSENNNKTDLNLSEKNQEIECDVPKNEDKPVVSESENNNKRTLKRIKKLSVMYPK